MAKSKKEKDTELRVVWGTGNTETTKEKIAKQQPTGEELLEERKGAHSSGVIKKPKDFVWQELVGITRDSRTLNSKEKTLYLWDNWEPKESNLAKRAAIGWDLSTAQEKAIFAIFDMLKSKSENHSNPEAEDYYMGNDSKRMFLTKETLSLGFNIKANRMPILRTNLREVGRFYYDTEKGLTGNEYKKALNVFRSIAETNYPIFIETTEGKKIITYIPLLYLQEEHQAENLSASANTEVVMALNPIFANGIGNDYFNFPKDLIQRIEAAYGSSSYTPKGVVSLAQYIIRIGALKRKNYDLALKSLCNIVARERMNRREYTTAKEMVFKALNTLLSIGLLLSYTPQEEKNLSKKIHLTINRSFK